MKNRVGYYPGRNKNKRQKMQIITQVGVQNAANPAGDAEEVICAVTLDSLAACARLVVRGGHAVSQCLSPYALDVFKCSAASAIVALFF